MKILQVISSFPPAFSYGGALKVAYDLSKELVNNGHDVTVFTTDAYDQHMRYSSRNNPEICEGLLIYHFRNISNTLAKKNYAFAPMMFFYFYRIIKTIDIIHIHEYRSFQAVFAYLWAKWYQIPYIIQAHGSVLPELEKKRVKRIFDEKIGKKILLDAKSVIAVTEYEKKQYHQMGIPISKIFTIPNSINSSEYRSIPIKGKFREKFKLEDNEKIILYLGRLHQRKGIDFLINAFSELLEINPKIRLFIIGFDDGYLNNINNMIKNKNINNKVFILGQVPFDGKLEAYVDADVLVYPGIFEIFGLVPFEAILCNTLVVVSNDCGCGEMINIADCGFTINYGDINELNECINKIFLMDIQEKEKLINNGKNFINNILNVKKNSRKIIELYKVSIK